MKTKAAILLTALVVLTVFFNAAGYVSEWKELKSDHFIVYYEGSGAFAKEVSRYAEKYYNRVADDLGYARHSKFWNWDNRVKIYISGDKDSFVKLAGCQEWCEGIADYAKRAIYSYSGSAEFLSATLPHEITHLVFRDFVGFGNNEIPLWMDEGVAQWEEPKKRELVKTAVKYLRENKKLIPLKQFIALNIMEVSDADVVNSYYIQSAGLVDLLMGRYGSEKFISFCRDLRDGKTMDDALIFAYPTDIRGVDELEKKWIEYVSKL